MAGQTGFEVRPLWGANKIKGLEISVFKPFFIPHNSPHTRVYYREYTPNDISKKNLH